MRLIEVAGTSNLRDLAGIGVDGGEITAGLLYRSDHLGDVDARALADLGVALVIDFRQEREIELDPDQLPADGSIRYINLPIGDPANLAELLADSDQVTDPAKFRAGITELWLTGRFDEVEALLKELQIDPLGERRQRYVSFVRDFAETWRRFFELLIEADGKPVIFHCHGGKDRTGAAAALLLLALGASRADVIDDYLATNTAQADQIAAQRSSIPDWMMPMVLAEREAMEALLDHVAEVHGGIGNYLQTELQITQEQIETIRSMVVT